MGSALWFRIGLIVVDRDEHPDSKQSFMGSWFSDAAHHVTIPEQHILEQPNGIVDSVAGAVSLNIRLVS